jgi:ATP/ADP translocase
LFASLWLLASDIFEHADKRTAAHAFSRIGAGTLAGGMLGGLMAKGLAPHLDPKWLIFLASLIIFSVIALVRHIHTRFPTNLVKQDRKKVKDGLLTPLVGSKYAITLLLISVTGAIAGLLIDFQFYAAAAGARMSATGNTNFFANFYILLNFSSLMLQLFATPKIQEKVGLRGGLMVLPVALIGGATFATAAATALSRSVLRVTEGGLRSSVHRSIWEQAFIPVASADRSTVKLVVDGVAARIAEVIGALAILLWLRHASPEGMLAMPLDTGWMSWAILATVVIWLIITQTFAVQTSEGKRPAPMTASEDIVCERFPDQCPCTTELGKGVA